MNYKKLYLMLFGAADEAERQIEAQNYGRAKQILIDVQQQAEEEYLARGEKSSTAE